MRSEDIFKRREGLKSWELQEIARKGYSDPKLRKLGGKEERAKAFAEAFPRRRFGEYISESDAKRRLRELRSQEYWAKGAEKYKIKILREALESALKLKGKY